MIPKFIVINGYSYTLVEIKTTCYEFEKTGVYKPTYAHQIGLGIEEKGFTV